MMDSDNSGHELCPLEKPFICAPYNKCYGIDEYCDPRSKAVESCYPHGVSGKDEILKYCQEVIGNVSQMLHPSCRYDCDILLAQEKVSALENTTQSLISQSRNCPIAFPWWAITIIIVWAVCSTVVALVCWLFPRQKSSDLQKSSRVGDKIREPHIAFNSDVNNSLERGRGREVQPQPGGNAGSVAGHDSTRPNSTIDYIGVNSENESLLANCGDSNVTPVGEGLVDSVRADESTTLVGEGLVDSVREDEPTTLADEGLGVNVRAGETMVVTIENSLNPNSQPQYTKCRKASSIRLRCHKTMSRQHHTSLSVAPGGDSRSCSGSYDVHVHEDHLQQQVDVPGFTADQRRDDVPSVTAGQRRDDVPDFTAGQRRDDVPEFTAGHRRDDVPVFTPGQRRDDVSDFTGGQRRDDVQAADHGPQLD